MRVAVADPRRLIAEALGALIANREGFSVTGAIVTEGAANAIAAQPPDVVVVGLGPDPRLAMELIRELRTRVPRVEIVIVADALEPALVSFVLDQGIGGLLLSDAARRRRRRLLGPCRARAGRLPSGWRARCRPIATIRWTRSPSVSWKCSSACRRLLL